MIVMLQVYYDVDLLSGEIAELGGQLWYQPQSGKHDYLPRGLWMWHSDVDVWYDLSAGM